MKYKLENAVSVAFGKAITEQYNAAVKEIAQSLIYRKSIPALYDEPDNDCYLAGAVVALMWMMDDKTGNEIEHDIKLAVANIEAGVID